ncbi:hypothetical protein [Rhodopila sp.]|jgi:hypothetical protein|uniref:hypothetical protein n=1 Tax=Rhodopila sp. TaxID=2480087 RepID=UPI002C3E2C00|nr:hypothetical protein [Rhodopila sp.]HVZ10515.1 hypothetical protein [Rhodopila sp.]
MNSAEGLHVACQAATAKAPLGRNTYPADGMMASPKNGGIPGDEPRRLSQLHKAASLSRSARTLRMLNQSKEYVF